MTIPDFETAKPVIEEHLSALEEIVISAWRDYQRDYVATRAIHSRRTMANIVRDHMIHHAKRVYAGWPGARIIDRCGLTLLHLAGRRHSSSVSRSSTPVSDPGTIRPGRQCCSTTSNSNFSPTPGPRS